GVRHPPPQGVQRSAPRDPGAGEGVAQGKAAEVEGRAGRPARHDQGEEGMSGAGLKTAAYTVRASMTQSIAWRRAAEGEGRRAVGTWLAAAADTYLKARARAGAPVPLAWHRGTFLITLPDGARTAVRGSVSHPFAAYRGTVEGPVRGGRTYVLLHLP